MTITSYLMYCRICNNNNLVDVIDLGEQIITSRFPIYGDYSTPKTPIVLCMCQDCGLIQLRETTDSSELYEYEYGYRSCKLFVGSLSAPLTIANAFHTDRIVGLCSENLDNTLNLGLTIIWDNIKYDVISPSN